MNCKRLLETFNWAATPLGGQSSWSDSLRASVSICLQHTEPALLLWGPEQTVIYNDAYSLLLGDKHPEAFGNGARRAWPAQWALRGKIVQSILIDGKPFHIENYKIPTPTNGVKEDRYFTLHGTGIQLERQIAGLFITAKETTDRVLRGSKIQSYRIGQLRDLFHQTPIPIAIFIGPEFVVEVANDAMLEIWGRTARKMLGKPVFESIPEARHQGFEELLNKVLSTGQRIVLDEVPYKVLRKGKIENTIIKLVYSPLTEEDGSVSGVIGLAEEITDQINLNKRIEEHEQRLQMAIRSSGLGTWEYDVPADTFSSSEECRFILGIHHQKGSSLEHFQNILPPGERRKMKYGIARARLNGTGEFSLVHRIRRDDDRQLRWIQSWGKIIFDKNGKPEKFMGVLSDITRQRENQDSLRSNDARMKLALAATDLGTFEYTATDNHVDYSEKTALIFGFDLSVKRSLSDFAERIHPDDRHIRDEAHQTLKKTGVLQYEVRLLLPDRTIRWIKADGIMVPGTAEKPETLYGIVRDVTQSNMTSRDLEQFIAARDDLNYRMINGVEDYAIISLDIDGTIQNWNTGAELIKGFKKEEVVGKSFSIFFLPEDRTKGVPERLMADAVNHGRATCEGWLLKKDGSKFWGSMVVTLLRNTYGVPVGFSKVTMDLSARKALEDNLMAHSKALQKRNQELLDFASLTSEQLQDSLHKIQSLSGEIQSSIDGPEKTSGNFHKINLSMQRMHDLISASATFRSVTNVQAEKELVDLRKILYSIKSDLKLVIQLKRAIVRINELPVVTGDAVQITHLFTNLISNAIKFSDRAPVVDISSRTVSQDEVADGPDSLTHEAYSEIKVADNGIGFTGADKTKLFGLFQRFHDREVFEGAGVGLAICKKVMDDHQGHITFRSESGNGTVFLVYFPLAESTIGTHDIPLKINPLIQQ